MTQNAQSTSFHVSNVDEFCFVVESLFSGKGLDVSRLEGFEARGHSLVLPDVAVLTAASNSRLKVEYPGLDFMRMTFPRRGHGSIRIGSDTIEVSAAQTCITSFDRPSAVAYEAEHELVNLRIQRSAIERKLTALLGAKPNGRFDCEPVASFRNPRFSGLRDLTFFLASRSNSIAAEYPPLVLRELEQTVITAFLLGTRHQFSDLLERTPADGSTSQLARIEAYIEAHWDQSINIEAIADESGLSARAVFRLFQRVRGYSPMAFAKMVRLQRANALLAAPNDRTSVSQTAFKCGFSNHGHFARDYRETFGELPSETLLRAKSRAC